MESKVVLTDKNPNDTANIFSKLFLTWSFKLFRRGYKQGITMADLFQARNGDNSGALGNRLEESWDLELENERTHGTKPSLTRAIVRSFWVEYMLTGVVVGFLFICLWPMIPFTLALFIQYFSHEKTTEAYRKAHIHNFSLSLVSTLSAVLYAHIQLIQGRVGMRVRVACCSLMYRKILKLNHNGLNKTEPGQVVNLMSNDVTRFDLASLYLNYVWIMPIVIPVVTTLVWQHIGVATLSALLVVVLQSIFVQVYLSRIQGTYRGKIAKRTDERIRVMGELVTGVRVIKMYAWEKPFEKIVDTLRKLEVRFVFRTSMVKGFSSSLGVFTERFVLFAAVVTFVLMGGHIRAQTTFALAQYFNLLQLAGNILIPMGLSFTAEALVSIKRIQTFLLLDEKNPVKIPMPNSVLESKSLLSKVEDEVTPEDTNSSGLSIVNVSASWRENGVVDHLRNITLTASIGEFIGIAGPVGSGKSSLLQLILGELKAKRGTVSLGGWSLSYASQEPWLFVATVKENILFGRPYDGNRYKKVVKACALLRDFELLPHGDSTLVGERGISLSGGQRARIGLARACYIQADIYLLDDPLSAVDTQVGKHLVSECVQGLLKDSTRILVTHQLHHLKETDKLLILRHGEIELQGTFEEVSVSPLFDELLHEEESDDAETTGDKEFQQNVDKKPTNNTLAEQDTLVDSPKDQEEVEEMVGTGYVPLSVFKKYFSIGNSWFILTCITIGFLVAQVVTSFGDLWLTHWMNDLETHRTSILSHSTVYNTSEANTTVYNTIETNTTVYNTSEANTTVDPITTVSPDVASVDVVQMNHSYYIYIWMTAIFSCIVLTSSRSFLFLWACMRSSIKLHNEMFSNIMGATMRVFDTNPSGRILNRFSKDMGIIDEVLPTMYLDSLQVLMIMSGILVMVAIVNPLMLINTGVCAVVMYWWTSVYLITAQGVKRVEAVARSPVYSHVTATMAGLGTVRACNAQHMLTKHFDDKQDIHTAAWYLTLVTNNAYQVWLSLTCVLYVIVVSYTFLLMDDGTTKSGNVGLAISQSLIITTMIQYGIKQATEVVSQMISVERIVEFTSLPQEKKDGSSPPEHWPKQGRVVFEKLSMRYDEQAKPVLRNLNMTIESGWKVGVVGRTGAGKSSLISVLFRLAPIDGAVCIDDINTKNLSLKELRPKISIIPQEPVLFSATLRYNVDPFEKYSDADIWQALDQVELKNSVGSLSAPVVSGGTNFSAGERQLLCLARAALARNKLLVLDEATANVDPATDTLIQKSIRKHFVDCTVITVAHRLHTVADSDRVLVMEAGQIVECGHPHDLLQNKEGYFTSMVKELGTASEHSLREISSKAYSEHIAREKQRLGQE